MLISRNTKLLAATLLALGMAACTTKKADVNEQGAAGQQGGAAGANAMPGSTGGGLDSEALGGANGAQGAGTSAASLLSTTVVHFDYDSANVMPNDYNVLKAHSQYLAQHPNAHVIVGGHTDERGTREYNMALGERRAKSVAAFLSSNGASPGQLEVVSFGEEKPLAIGESESAWAENRRVELNYTAGKP